MDSISLINFDCSMKDIPFCKRKFYINKMFDQKIKFVNRMRWRAFFYEMHNNGTEQTIQRTKGQASTAQEDRHQKWKKKAFETDLFDSIKEINFKSINPNTKTQYKNIKKLLSANKIIVPSDKTSNFYYVNIKTCKKLLLENITKDFKITDNNTINFINSETARILASKKIKSKKITKYVTN